MSLNLVLWRVPGSQVTSSLLAFFFKSTDRVAFTKILAVYSNIKNEATQNILRVSFVSCGVGRLVYWFSHGGSNQTDFVRFR